MRGLLARQRQIECKIEQDAEVRCEAEHCQVEKEHNSVRILPEFPEEVRAVNQIARDHSPT